MSVCVCVYDIYIEFTSPCPLSPESTTLFPRADYYSALTIRRREIAFLITILISNESKTIWPVSSGEESKLLDTSSPKFEIRKIRITL